MSLYSIISSNAIAKLNRPSKNLNLNKGVPYSKYGGEVDVRDHHSEGLNLLAGGNQRRSEELMDTGSN